MFVIKCLVALALVAVFGHSALAQNCTGQWQPYFDDFCVWTSIEKVSWMEAVNLCKVADAGLVHIYDESQNADIAKIVKAASGKRKFWIGMTKIAEEEFRWLMDVPVTFNNFKDDMELEEKENCVFVDKKGKWKTEECTEELPFICARMTGGLTL